MAAKKKSAGSKSAARSAKGKGTKTAAAKPARAAGAKSEALSLRALSPSLTVNDVAASLAWYRDVLGFKEGERWEREGKLAGVELVAGKTTFMLGQDDWKKGRDRDKGQGVRLYCMTDQDIDGLAARIKAKGGKLTQEPKDEPWGVRDLAIDDPDGYMITIAAALKGRR